MTDEQFTTWLRSPQSLRCVLVEVAANVAGVETQHYLSSSGYVTSPTEAPVNTNYAPCIVGGVTLSEELPIGGNASISYGDIEIANPDGQRDNWLSFVWSNRPITVYVGDMRWARADFRKIFDGVVDDLKVGSIDSLNLLIRDKSQRLNTAITEATLGGATSNKDSILPLCFGECHNISPLLTDPANLEYQFHNGQAERIIEVRDNGVPVGYTPLLATGKFRLLASPVGAVTASVQGAKPDGSYSNRVGVLVPFIAKTYGTSPIADSDIDSTNISAFDVLHTASVGIYVADRSNVLDICQQLAASVGAQVHFNALGKLSLKKISLPTTAASSVSYSTMLENSISVAERPKVSAGVKLGYCKNWTVQAALTSGLPSEHISLFEKEWLTVSSQDTAVASTYNITTAPEQVDTLLLTSTDATAEAIRRKNLWTVQRTIISYTGTPDTMLLKLGDGQTITHHRFGLSSGVTGQIVRLSVDWLSLRSTVGVLI